MEADAPKLLLTPGEPAGIGPELTLRAACSDRQIPFVAVCDPSLLKKRAQQLGIVCPRINTLDLNAINFDHEPGTLNCIPVSLGVESKPGVLDKRNASYVLETLRIANQLCINKAFEAIVTGPVQKSIINEAGIPFSGHTEFFAENSNTPKVVMMLATEGLRVALATTHLPLKDVSAAITQDSLTEILTILIAELQKKFGIASPTILVTGLNPHAGEGGHLGHEEIETITPALNKIRAHQKAQILGPLPADTLFTPHYLKDADAVLAMYHDQGLPVLKHMGFGKAVNITLGLPYIRTSVDHGTALDLAACGGADAGSMMEAIKIARELVKTSHH